MNKRTIRTVGMWLALSVVSGVMGTREFSARAGWVPAVDSRLHENDQAVGRAMEVYRRGGCGDWVLARITAEWAGRRGLPAEVVAAMVVVESTCNPKAVSSDGSVGLMQVRVETWSKTFKFRRKDMLEAKRSLEVGTEILRRNIARHGVRKGIERYNGQGVRARLYADKVLKLARRAQ